MSFQKQFEALFAETNNVLEIKPEHKNGTGYFDDLSRDTTIGKVGEAYKFTEPNGRYGIVMCGEYGNVVIFTRYSDRQDVLCFHACTKKKSAAGEHLTGDLVDIVSTAIAGGGDINDTLVNAIDVWKDNVLKAYRK